MIEEHLRYDPITGELWWKLPRRGRQLHKPAGTINGLGYVAIWLDGKSYLGHRVAWYLTYGYWPKILDHKDRNPSNNRITNLREVTQSQNMHNNGKLGVSMNRGKFMAHIMINGKAKNLGRFSTLEEALDVRRRFKTTQIGELD